MRWPGGRQRRQQRHECCRPPGWRRGGDMPACGQLLRHLTTGFGQPCGVRWTPPGCPHLPVTVLCVAEAGRELFAIVVEINLPEGLSSGDEDQATASPPWSSTPR